LYAIIFTHTFFAIFNPFTDIHGERILPLGESYQIEYNKLLEIDDMVEKNHHR